MKVKKKKPIFVCQITGEALKVIKGLSDGNSLELIAAESEAIAKNDDNDLSQKLDQVLKKLGYDNKPIIVSLPRNSATLRFLKIPSADPQELDRILALQASTFLPYSSAELITGYESIFIDNEGCSHLNLIIVHKDIIKRYINLFERLNIRNFTIALSSYGICNLYNYFHPEEPGPVMILDIDSVQVELDIVNKKKVIFSRYFNLNLSGGSGKDTLVNEINKTQDAFFREVAKEKLMKIVFIQQGKRLPENWQAVLPLVVEEFKYLDKINCPQETFTRISNCGYSFASLIGSALKEVPASLNLLPADLKEERQVSTVRNEKLRLAALFLGIIALLTIGMVKNLDNKTKYLKQLKIEMAKIANEAKPFEEIDKRFEFMGKRQQKKPSVLEIFSELHKIIPSAASLVDFSYEENNQVILRGLSPTLDSVFAFAAELEKSSVLKDFKPKIRYATQKRTSAGELVDFEIVCVKK